ncbi:hypothetical protein MAJ_11535, partial [Metarhizium majus ARSEF 297]
MLFHSAQSQETTSSKDTVEEGTGETASPSKDPNAPKLRVFFPGESQCNGLLSPRILFIYPGYITAIHSTITVDKQHAPSPEHQLQNEKKSTFSPREEPGPPCFKYFSECVLTLMDRLHLE